MREIRVYSKQFAALATVWLTRYRSDPFFRTEVHVIALQVAFGIVILGLAGISFSLLYRDISAAIVDGIRAGVDTNAPGVVAAAIVGKIEEIRMQNMFTIGAVIVLTTILFGYIIARATLVPARNALAAQKQFIGNIAHELRTPLAVIKTNTEIALLDPHMTADLKLTHLSNVEELDRASEIINNLLSLSALIRPERMEFTFIDLSALVSQTVEKFSHLAKQNEQEVVVRKSPGALVWGSSTALQQIVGNLVKNALMYTARGGHIAVTIEPTDAGQVRLTVEDTGIGIARKDLFRIFEPFYRAEQSRNRARGGSGLGLAIVSELVKLHQGKITIRSAIGRGTTVSILFPAAKKRADVGGKELRTDHSEIAVDFSRRS
ncbi:MAG TPA: HAMP domain-containing sensor histidine kinase [Candidatus Paceibacterota bacterium]